MNSGLSIQPRNLVILILIVLSGCALGAWLITREVSSDDVPPEKSPAACLEAALMQPDPSPFLLSEAYETAPADWEVFMDETEPIQEISILERSTLYSGRRVVLDFKALHPDGSESTLAAHLEQDEQGTWRIFWIRGPGGSWPRVPDRWSR